MGREVPQQQQQQVELAVEQLLAGNPYNPAMLSDLENYVNEQALMAMPSTDFNLCLFLIPERVQMKELFKTLIVLSHYLETRRFSQIWDEASKNHHIVEAVPEEAIRRSNASKRNDLEDLRKVSRQEYLKKREQKKLEEIRDNIEDEQYLFDGVRLTEAEYRELSYKKQIYELVKMW